ncbi:pseudouridine synthase [Devosia sp. YIM 151766]|uniref:pseudouridine synthase n=1 Tax=Devosia sp. YIM 151766 TaxID=3017325 RepID=UPI00255C9E6A|nr:pseudouridine synthase [Devosia sp. YIM 151766]WIY53425.1 pseudouridine synthase [Devosia sp. YIM 151766]
MSDTPKQPENADRLAKVIARAGLCSRRDAEGWIADGRISVNGKKVLTPAFNVTSRDKIEVDGLPLAARQGTRIWLYHKPAGLVVTEKDPEGRATIFEALDRKGLPRVLTVGRLDINTEGLLLLTNDGGLKRVLELPATGWLRRYRVRAHGSVTQAQLDGLKNGIAVEGVQYGPIQATLEREQGANVWLVLGLREGKNREVKNVLGSLGLEVNRLIRISYGPFQLGDLAEGAVEMVKSRMLRDQLGKKLAEAAGVDFDSEMPEMPAPRDERPVRSPRDRDHSRPNPARGAATDQRRPSYGRDAEERPTGRPRRIHFDDDGRAPEAFVPKAPPRSRHAPDDRPARGFGKPAPRGDRPQGGKPFGDKPKRDFGDRPPRSGFGDRPARGGFADQPKRDYGDKPARTGFSDRPKRDSGDRAQRSFGDKPARGARPERGFEDRPKRPYGDRPQGGRPGGKPFAGRPDGKPFSGKPGGPRPGGRPTGGRPPAGRPPAGRPPAGRPPAGRPPAGRPPAGRPPAGRPPAGRPAGPRKPRNDR